MLRHSPENDPWVLEAQRASEPSGSRRPDLSAVPPLSLFSMGVLAALRALGLVMIAESVARGIGTIATAAMTPETSRVILLLGIGGILLRAGAEWATAVQARRIATSVKHALRRRLWRRIVSGNDRGGSAAVLASDGLDALDDYYIQSLPALISAAVVPLLIGVRILGADWVSALVIVLTVPLVPVFMVLIGKHTQQRTDAALTALTRLADHLTELARGLPVLVGLGRVDEQTRALDDIQRNYRERTEETLRWAFLSALALELIATISVAVVAVFLGLRLLDGSMELTPALLALILAPECFTALRDVGAAFHASQDGLSALHRAQELLDAPEAKDARRPGTEGIRVELLRVDYPGRHSPALQTTTADLSGITVVTGASGTGKSTLLSALAGVLPADATVSGRVSGVPVGSVAYVPQAPRAFEATPLAELAVYGADAAALAELGLADLAHASVNELSPGEQRRLGVARGLARVGAGAELLVLDEPTAHLDAASADLVRAAIRRRASQCTIVLASHEAATRALATRSVAMEAAPTPETAPVPAPTASPEAAPRSRASAADAVRMTSSSAASPAARSMASASPKAARAATSAATELTLRGLLRPHRWLWLGSMAMSALAVGLGIALTAVSGWLIVRASIEEYIMYLLVAIVGVRAFGIGRAVGRYAERLLTHRAAFEVVDALRLRLWRTIAARGAGSRRLLEGGAPLDYLVTLSGDLRDQLPRVLAPLGGGVLVIVAAIVTTAFIAPHLTLLVALTLLISVVLAAALAIITERGAGAARVQARSKITRSTAALAHAADDLRGNGVTDSALRMLDADGRQLAEAEQRASWSAGLAAAVITVATTLLAVLTPLLSAGLPAELVSVIALLALGLLEPLAALVDAIQRVPALRALLRRLGALLRPTPTPRWGADAVAEKTKALELDDVAIRYPGAQHPAVTGLTGTARRGHWLILTGPSGSGKSTVLSAVMGALPVEQGAIRADGAALTTLEEAAWRSRVAWCPQDAYVFDSTLRGNLLLARARHDAPDDTEMTHALTRAGLGTLVSGLADGLATRVGQGGSALSGGERQRLSVARALLSRADVILLDEPTAHLDEATAAAMMTDVRAATARRVVMLVSHRAADQQPTDDCVVLPAR